MIIRLLLLCVLAFMLPGPGRVAPRTLSAAADGVRVLATTNQTLVLELTLSPPVVEQVVLDGVAYDRLRLADAVQTMTPGAPQVPYLGKLVGLPAAAGVSLRVLELDTETRSGLRLVPAPHVHLADPAAEVPDPAMLQETVSPDPAYYGADAFFPARAAEVGEVGMVRDQAVTQVRFFPVQYNPVSGELRFHRRIRVELRWEADPGLAATPVAVAPRAYEDVLRATLLNYATLERPSVVSPDPLEGSIERGVAPALAGTRLKVSVDAPGLYKITAGELAQAGMDLTGIDPRTLQLRQRGQEVALLVAGQEDGRFDADDYLLFYGDGLDTLYTGTNVYWLTVGTAPGLRMATRSVPPGSASTPAYFPTTLHAEENSDYWRAMPDGAGQDHWFWGARLNATESRSYTIRLPELATSSDQATVRVQLKGFSDLQAISPDHRTRIYVNGTRIDDQPWDGQAVFEHTVQVAHSLLRTGDNSVRIESVGLPDPEDSDERLSPDQIWVNWIELDYRAAFVASDDTLVFGAPQPGTFRFQVTDFQTDAIALFDISDAARVVQLTGAEVSASDEGYRLRFQDAATATTRYLAQTSNRYKTPLALAVDQPSNWQDTANRADYIIITHQNFMDAAERLAEHRQAGGLRVALVDVADLYDEFNDGIFDPAAIRDFLAYAYQNWQAPAPTYVVLMGDAYWDYRDYKQTGTPNYVPAQTVQTNVLGDTPSDNWFVAVSGADILPDMLIGRLAVQTPQQAGVVVDKIIAYDQTPPAAPWNRRALLVADDDDPDFEAYAEALAERLPDTFTADRVYAAHYPPGNPATDIASAINQGRLLVYYTGHGKATGWGTWGNGGRIFERDPDVSGLQNNGRLPVVVVANCLNGFFVGASNEISLAEEFQRLENRGAIAVWAATALDYPSGHKLLMDHFYAAIFGDAQRGLGLATTRAKIETYAQSDFWGDLVEMYVLFGDPATEIGVLREDLPADPPEVVLTDPADGASEVALDAAIRVVFSAAMNPDTMVLSGLDDLVLAPAWNDSYTVVTYAHTGFAPGQTRTVSIGGQSAVGLDMSQAYTWTFRTVPPVDDAESVTISGPRGGITGTEYTFGATLGSGIQPASYVWQASDHAPVTHAEGAAQDVISFTWETTGEKVITVTATSERGTATATHVITISAPTLTGVSITGAETGRPGQQYTFTARISPQTARLPVDYSWEASDQAALVHNERESVTDTASFTWDTSGEKTITVTATNIDGTVQQSVRIRIGTTPVDEPEIRLFLPLLAR